MSLKGEYEQEIPIFSAKKLMGKHLYDYARKDLKVKKIKNKIIIYDIKFLSFKSDEINLKIKCSSGTYIRSIAHDIGKRLNCGAVLSKLIRLKINNFNLKDAITTDELINIVESSKLKKYKFLIPIENLAKRKKTIYVYKKYIKILNQNSPLYSYMININKTKNKDIFENEVLIIKNYNCKQYFIHKSLISFNTLNVFQNNQKLTRYIFKN